MSALHIGVGLFWVLFGLALAQQSVALGLSGPGGPGSGLFPLLAAILITTGASACWRGICAGVSQPGRSGQRRGRACASAC